MRTLIHECDGWLERLSVKYQLPRAALVTMLDRPGALEYEIAVWIGEHAKRRAADLFAADEPPPAGMDLWDRAVRGVYRQLEQRRDAADAAERQRQYAETDDLLRRIKAGEDV